MRISDWSSDLCSSDLQGAVSSRCAALSATSTLCPPLTAAPRCAKGSAIVAPAKDGIRDRRGGDETPQLSGHDPDPQPLLGRPRLRDPTPHCHPLRGGTLSHRPPPPHPRSRAAERHIQ